MAKDFNTILSEAQQIKNEIIEGANTALRTGTCLEDIVQRAESDEDLAAKKARTITAGNGLTGGGSLATDMELTVGATDDSIVVGADGIKVDTQDSLTSTSITKPLSAAKGKALQDTKANKTVIIEAGNGLTGGGDLSGNITLAVASANDGISTNADNIQLNTIDALDSTSATKPLSAKQGKALQDNKADKSRKVNAGLGLTGGGDLGADRTIDVVSANDGITVNADNIQINTIDNVTSTSVTKPLSANQGKVLNDKVVQVETNLNLDEYTIAEAFNLLYRKIISLETIIANGIFKNLQVDNLTTVNAFNYNGAPLIVVGSTAPSSAPDFVGQTYINTTAPGTVYSAKGVSSVSDWKQTSN